MADRRTLIVLGSLLGSMTVASGALLMLDPGQPGGPRLPKFSEVSLAAFDQPADPADALFAVNPLPTSQRWTTIVVRYSGSDQGSASTLGELHKRAGLGDLAYHFVIGNGQGSPDGQIEIGPRWDQQRPGYTSIALHNQPGSHEVIDVCVVGDLDRHAPSQQQQDDLLWLVRQLQERLNVPAERVLLGDGRTGGAGAKFPSKAFRASLLNPTGS
ncbi:MAG: N-acetylmuramoyl-L-alanine amidase [Phycisphaeraceae bacterium]